MPHTILHIDASARRQDSASRQLSAAVVAELSAAHEGSRVIRRELDDIPPLDEKTLLAFATPAESRTPAQAARAARSEALIAELRAADAIVIGTPIYNFGVPAPLKAWIDQVARAGITFRYTEAGPEGLLKGKCAYLAIASGGTPVGSAGDFVSGYLTHVLGFLGITDVAVLAADRMAIEPEDSLQAALARARTLARAA